MLSEQLGFNPEKARIAREASERAAEIREGIVKENLGKAAANKGGKKKTPGQEVAEAVEAGRAAQEFLDDMETKNTK